MTIKAKPRKKLGTGQHARWRKAGKYLAAVGTLASYSAMAEFKPDSLAFAQVPPQFKRVSTPADVTTGGAAMRQFNIESGPLSVVADAFKKATRLQIEYTVQSIGNVMSPGVKGTFTIDQALQELLKGTGISSRYTGPETVVLELKNSRQAVDVHAGFETVQSPKYTEPLRDIPQSITVIPKAVMEQQGATTLREVLRNVPGLTIAAGEGGTPAGDNITLRGFTARNDIYVDGVRDLNPQSRDPFNFEQVEVSKGPNSAIAGRSSGAGTINMVNKAPNLNRYFGASLALGNADLKRVTTDVNLPLRAIGFGERTAFRMNSVYHDAEYPGREAVDNHRWGLAPSLAFGLASPTRLTLSYYTLRQNNISDYGIPWVPATNTALVEYRNQPAPVPRSTFYGLVDRDREVLKTNQGTVRFEHDFSDSVHVRNQLRYAQSIRNSIASPPRFANTTSTDINREMRAWNALDKIWDNQTDLNAQFSTGAIEHALVGGGNFTSENNIRKTLSGQNMPTSFLNPNPHDVYTGPLTPGAVWGNVTGNTQAAYLFDTAKFGKHIEAVGGWRVDRFDVSGITTANVRIAQTNVMNSYRGALVYKPVESGSVYATYSSALSPSLEGLSYGTSSTAIPPEKTSNVEVGTKWEVFPLGRLMMTGALFRVAKDNARTPGLLPDDPPQVLQGTQISQGVEVGLNGRIARNWNFMGSYTYIDGRIRSSNNPAEIGHVFLNTPKNSYSIWSTYQMRKLLIGGGPRYVSLRYGDNANTRWVPSYWTFDAMASYAILSSLDLRFNVSNANDAYYFDRLGGGHVVPGPARQYMVTTNFHF